MKAIGLAATAAATFSSFVAGAAPSTQNTHAYILRSPEAAASSPISSADADADASLPPTLAANVARAIIHQRLSLSDRTLVSLHDILQSDDSGASSALAQIAAFGRPEPQLFEHVADQPWQNIILVEGLKDGEAAVLEAGFGGADFVLEGSVAAEENEWLVRELLGVGVDDAVRIDVKKNPEELDNLITNIDELRRLAGSGITETIVLAFPDASNARALQKWSSSPALRRRQAGSESVMTETDSDSNAAPSSHITFVNPDSDSDSDSSLVDVEENTTTPNPSKSPFAAAVSTPVAACFDTFDACVAGTGNCTAHGQCRNRWGPEAGGEVCWACHCMMSADGTQWGGDVCHKIDISTPFWLLAGTSFVLVWVVGGAVAMLYSVGEQKLPGVLGAGVSKK
jgi:hypothetical protein